MDSARVIAEYPFASQWGGAPFAPHARECHAPTQRSPPSPRVAPAAARSRVSNPRLPACIVPPLRTSTASRSGCAPGLGVGAHLLVGTHTSSTAVRFSARAGALRVAPRRRVLATRDWSVERARDDTRSLPGLRSRAEAHGRGGRLTAPPRRVSASFPILDTGKARRSLVNGALAALAHRLVSADTRAHDAWREEQNGRRTE